MVEAQHHVSTRSLVDTLDEQKILEDIIDEVKPPRPRGPEFDGLDYLLFTPFRHPPLRSGSRFGCADQRSLFYAAEAVSTALAEKAYYALLLVDGTRAELEKSDIDWTAFQVGVRSRQAIDLTAAPFDRFTSAISSPTSYVDSQALGTAMRAEGIELVRYQSARCPDKGANVGLFAPVFTTRTSRKRRTWRCLVTRESCEVFDLNASSGTVLDFPRSLFAIAGRLPRPAV